MLSTQDGSQASPSEQSSRSLTRDWWEALYPRDFINTVTGFLRNHKTFFDDVFSEKWEKKVKPIPFFVICYSLMLLAASLSPKDPFETPPSWDNVYNLLNEKEKREFVEAFGCEIREDQVTFDCEPQIQKLTRLKESINGTYLQAYFEKIEKEDLAQKVEYIVLKDKGKMESNDLLNTVLVNLLLFYFVISWRASHRFLKARHRTPRQTVYVYMYNMSMVLLFVVVPFTLLLGFGVELTYLWYIPVVALFYLLYKGARVFRHTHNVGVFRLIWATFAGFWLWIPGLFVPSKSNVAAEKS